MPLVRLEDLHLIAWRDPQLPCRDTSGIPIGVLVRRARSPEVSMPTEAIDGLAADAAMPATAGVLWHTIKRRWHPKGRGEA